MYIGLDVFLFGSLFFLFFLFRKGVLVFYIHCNVCKTCRLFRNLKLAENVKRKLSSMIKIYCYLKICVIPSATVGERLHIVYYSHNIFHIYFLDTAVINFYFRLFLTILKHHTGKNWLAYQANYEVITIFGNEWINLSFQRISLNIQPLAVQRGEPV